MMYEEFKAQEDLKREQLMIELQRKADDAYNRGLWGAVKWNPLKWWVFLVFRRPA